MANPQQLNLLLSGIDKWNEWRRVNRSTLLDFTGADLRKRNLCGADLTGANFSRANLVGADLSLSKLYGAVFTDCILLGTNFQGAHLMEADLSSSNANGADFRNAFLLGARVENSSLFSVKYNRWAIYRGIRLSGSYGSQLFLRFAHDQSFIEEFRGQANARPLIKVSGKAHFLRQCFAHVKTFPSIRKQNPKKYKSWLIYLLWSIMSDCGRSFSLWFMWSLLFAIFFGAVYAGYPVPDWLPEPLAHILIDIAPSIDTQGRDATAFTPYYFSFVTFTTLGFGDVLPKNLAGELWLTLEVVLGYVMLGGLISIFATKVSRRAA